MPESITQGDSPKLPKPAQNADATSSVADWHPLHLEDESPFAPTFPAEDQPLSANPVLGVAIDLGTTQLRLSLWDLGAKRRVGALTGNNPQAVYGSNILSRLEEAGKSEDKARELARLVHDALAGALVRLADQTGVNLERVRKLVIVGNTAMLSLFCGEHFDVLLRPGHWTREMMCRIPDPRQLARRWGLPETARIALTQPLAGFVGSDLLANVLAIKLLERPAGSLLLDFGTNTEIALWDGNALWVTSTPGGCAFVGPGTVPARPGAVCRISGGDQAKMKLHVIGGGNPQGVCGSGLVDLIALLLERGQLDRLGRFKIPVSPEGFPFSEELPGAFLRSRDIDRFQRAKGAMAAAIHFLLLRAGLRLDEIHQTFVSGAFGQFLDIGHAQRVGLLPPLAPERISLAGDAALAGCEHLLLSPKPFTALASIRNRCILFNLGDALAFEDLFIENLYLAPMQGGTGTPC